MARSRRSRRKRKNALAQSLVGVAAAGLPSPLRSVVTSRWGAHLTLLLVPLLIAGGIISLDWSHGFPPRLSVNWQRTAEVKARAAARAEELKEKYPEAVQRAKEVLEQTRLGEHLGQGMDWPRTSATAPPPANPRAIRVATFNIQVLGESKASKPHVMQVLADVVRRFDVVAIQELRTTNEAVMENFLALVNGQGGTYRYVVGPRLGRTVSKEQYVYVFDAARVAIDPQSVLTMSDPGDYLHREPLIARFQVRTSPPEAGFSFILVNIHTDPDETDQELDALDDVFTAVQRNGWREDDVILLGDLNVDSRKLGQLGRVPGITWIVDGQPTNTRGTKSYDNILFDQTATLEFTGQAGILNLLETYGLSMDQALEVSDHLPVWAEFDVFERSAQTNVAALPASYPPAATGMAPPSAGANGGQDGILRSRLPPR